MSRRRLALVVGVMLAVTGCSGGSDDEEQPLAGREVAHALGVTQVPERPVRVVVLDVAELDAVAALGITPVGAPPVAPQAPVPEHVRDALGPAAATIRSTGPLDAPDLGAITALDPDLVLSNRVRSGALYEQLSAIAPTVLAEASAGPAWKAALLLVGEALGRRDDAQRLLDEHEARADAVGGAWRGAPRLAAARLRFAPTGLLLGARSFAGSVLADVGFRSTTRVADADLLLVSASASGKPALAQARRGPGWRLLPAVRTGRALIVSDELWSVAAGPLTARLLLDDLQRYAAAVRQ